LEIAAARSREENYTLAGNAMRIIHFVCNNRRYARGIGRERERERERERKKGRDRFFLSMSTTRELFPLAGNIEIFNNSVEKIIC